MIEFINYGITELKKNISITSPGYTHAWQILNLTDFYLKRMATFLKFLSSIVK